MPLAYRCARLMIWISTASLCCVLPSDGNGFNGFKAWKQERRRIRIAHVFKPSSESLSVVVQDVSRVWRAKNKVTECFLKGLICNEGYTTAENVTYFLQGTKVGDCAICYKELLVKRKTDGVTNSMAESPFWEDDSCAGSWFAFYGTRSFIAVFTRARHRSLMDPVYTVILEIRFNIVLQILMSSKWPLSFRLSTHWYAFLQ
jgi:hypothetical protein